MPLNWIATLTRDPRQTVTACLGRALASVRTPLAPTFESLLTALRSQLTPPPTTASMAVALRDPKQALADLRTQLEEVVGSVLTALWSEPTPTSQWVPAASIAPSDNLQRPMNLIMPLRRPNVIARGKVAQALFTATDEIVVGLNNVGTVHFARFDLIAGNLCMFSIYDGELNGYIRDFVAVIGDAFDTLLGYVKDPPPTPVGYHIDQFLEWIENHDAFQLPEQPTDITTNLADLRRQTLILLHRHPNVQLGIYRGYPGFSAAQIRQQLAIGW